MSDMEFTGLKDFSSQSSWECTGFSTMSSFVFGPFSSFDTSAFS